MTKVHNLLSFTPLLRVCSKFRHSLKHPSWSYTQCDISSHLPFYSFPSKHKGRCTWDFLHEHIKRWLTLQFFGDLYSIRIINHVRLLHWSRLWKKSFCTQYFNKIRSFKPIYVFMPYINESNIQFPSCVASLQVASNVDVIVSDDPSDQIRCGDAFSPLRGHKHPWCWNINTLLNKQVKMAANQIILNGP